MKKTNQRTIAKLFKLNGVSTCLIVPKQIAKRMGLFTQPAYVTFEDTPDGILIRKLEI